MGCWDAGMLGLTRLAFEIEEEYCGCHDGRIELRCWILCVGGLEMMIGEGEGMGGAGIGGWRGVFKKS